MWCDAGLRSLLPPDVWDALQSEGRRRTYERGERLLSQGDEGTSVIVLVEGRVKVTCCQEDGGEVLLAIRGPGDILGERAAFDGGARSATVTALGTCVARVLGGRQFVDFVSGRDLWRTMLNFSVARQRESQSIRVELTTLPVCARLARTLLRLAGAAEPGQDGATAIELGIPQEELGRAIGASRSHVTECLKQMRDEGILSTSRQRIVIHSPEGLRAFDARWSPA